MKKDVLVSVAGMQFGPDSNGEKIEIITGGSYYKKKDKHYVLYEEVGEGQTEVTKNTLKFDDKVVQIIKRGFTNVDMVFEENKRNMTNYVTPFGTLLVGTCADRIDVQESSDKIAIAVDYALDVNYEHLANCQIRMDIISKTSDALSI